MSFSQEANSSKSKRQILDMKITKFLPFVCLQTAFEYQQCMYILASHSTNAVLRASRRPPSESRQSQQQLFPSRFNFSWHSSS